MHAGIQQLTGTRTNFTFGADTTYLVDGADGPVHLTGVTTIEGGTVVKFARNPDAKIIIDVSDATSSRIVCKTAPYAPAIFCFGNNDDYGYYGAEDEYPTPGPYGQGLSLTGDTATPVVLKNLRFFDLACGVSFDGHATYKLYHCQFADCETALAQTDPNAAIGIYNALFCDDTNVFHWAAGGGNNPNITFQHVTADNCTRFAYGLPSPPSGGWSGKNSLLVATHEPGSIPSGLDGTCSVETSATGVFLTGSDGSHYLPEVSDYRTNGTLAIDADLRNELAQKTTRPPLTLPWFMAISGSLTFSPQAIRYVPGDLPDRGYYYDALDYTVSAMQVTGGSITVLPGTAIGLRYDYWFGFDLWEGSSFISRGLPDRPVTFAPASAVQEGPFFHFRYPGFQISFMPDYWPNEDGNPEGNPPPTLDFQFSNLYLNSGISHHFWSGMPNRFLSNVLPWRFLPVSSAMSLRMRDCHLLSGWLNLGEPNGRVIWPPADLGGQSIPGSVSLVNNLFERVNISLDPDTGPCWWGGGQSTATIDLSLAATNNLFRGGWLFLAPAPASAGDWVFENNLFDKVVLAQDQSQPLDYDYNAYWPCVGTWPDPDAELFPGQIAHLFPTTTTNGYTDGTYDDAHEIKLTAAPPYQTGPLGDFYIDNTTPTQLHHAGSCPPAQAGLYHYTTSLDQTKEGAGARVDIGLHYVATKSTTSREPQDSDSPTPDGIPDYVENWHGDGRRDWPDETDWQNAYTATGVYDPTNALYDDTDLSGDGLVGRIKKALGMTPFDASNPLTLTQVFTGDEPDIVTFEVPVNYNSLATKGALTLFVDGENAAFAACVAAPNTNCLLSWNTTYEPPGQHYPAAYLTLSDDASDHGVGSALGKLAAFYSPNVVQFDEAFGQYDENGAVLYALLPQANASFTIELLDPANPSSPHIRTITGSTSSGEIELPWNVTYDDGATAFTGDQVQAVFSANLLDDPASGTSKQMLNRATVRVPDGTFDVAFMWDHDNVAQPFYGAMWNTMQYAVVDTLMQPCFDWPVYKSTFNRFTWLDPGYPGYLPDWDAVYNGLLPDLSNSWTRNFYFKGHGADDALSDGKCLPSPPYARLWRVDVEGTLRNSYDPWEGIRTRHPYRFVFLDCCSAGTLAWQHAFGITEMRLQSPKDDRLARTGPQAFVGWTSDRPGCAGDASAWEHYGDTLEVFFSAWMLGYPLADCVKFASDRHSTDPIYGRPLTKPFPVPKNKDLWGWSSKLRIGGYRGITEGSYVPGY
jgi:hypothetical protein